MQSASLKTCLRLATAQDAILLIEDGVYTVMENTITTSLLKEAPAELTIYALTEDINMRGIAKPFNSTIKLIDYAGFVELTLAHHPIHTWS